MIVLLSIVLVSALVVVGGALGVAIWAVAPLWCEYRERQAETARRAADARARAYLFALAPLSPADDEPGRGLDA